MIHLVDSDIRLDARRDQNFIANCGVYIESKRASLRNNWGSGQCKPWLSARDICASCRDKAMEPSKKQFTYGIIISRRGGQ